PRKSYSSSRDDSLLECLAVSAPAVATAVEPPASGADSEKRQIRPGHAAALAERSAHAFGTLGCALVPQPGNALGIIGLCSGCEAVCATGEPLNATGTSPFEPEQPPA